MTAEHIVYALVDPTTGEDRYVGCTGNGLKRRLTAHMTSARRARVGRGERMSKKHEWILGLLDLGHVPDVRVLCRAPRHKVLSRERSWILRLSERGSRLFNVVGTPSWYDRRGEAFVNGQVVRVAKARKPVSP